METKKIPLSKLHLNTGQIKDVPKNPRFIKDERFAALKKSIEDDPEMLSLRELVAYDNSGELIKKFSLNYCSVLEDNENGAEVIKNH